MTSQPALDGRLEAFWETGVEGVRWSFVEDGKGLEGLHPLKNGDILTVFNDAARTSVAWQGAVDLDLESGKTPNPVLSHLIVQQAGPFAWVVGLQKNVDPAFWAELFAAEKPARLTPAPAPGV